MTMWFNHRFPGFALTVEYGAAPSASTLRGAPDRILKIFGAWRGGVVGVPRSG
jgi:murein peptide amidase A